MRLHTSILFAVVSTFAVASTFGAVAEGAAIGAGIPNGGVESDMDVKHSLPETRSLQDNQGYEHTAFLLTDKDAQGNLTYQGNSTMPWHSFETPHHPVNPVDCKTSHASPTFEEIDQLIPKLENRKHACDQNNAGGSKCRRLEKYKGGEVSLCGGHQYAMTCKKIAWAVFEIKKYCGNKGMHRAGGQMRFGGEGKLRVVVH
ncbi:hypothetical protein BZA05DRAFT_447797 [Tricharina praecox]|uniref:uncharacterized protein n=1 Tax=Tricharina praecox TaxID=43433 RepID=UPI00221F88CA|nr:uncharacterized protein BZA05DRAFT_447797 [Tricharina praecox]KAI5845474.1 hypothetical protein BZA05DRAFT_447797 [Tricharina praecox]